MQITIRLLASYRRYLPEGHDHRAGFLRQFPGGATAGEVLATLPIPRDDPFTCLVNGRHAELDQELHDGDALALFPAVGGG